MKWNSFLFYAPILLLGLILVVIGINVVWKNVLLKDVVFSYSALVAAFIMFILNLFFSLNPEEKNSTVTSYIIHKDSGISVHDMKPSLGEHHLKFDVFNRKELCLYNGIQHSINAKHLDVPERHRLFDKVQGVAKIIFIGDMLGNMPDWDMKDTPFRNGGGKSYRIKLDNNDSDTFFNLEELTKNCDINYPESLLTKFVLSEGLVLPPKTKIKSINNGLVICNSYVEIKITFEINLNFEWNLKFRADGTPYTIFDNSEHEYNMYTMHSTIRTKFNSKYVGSRNLDRYRKWSDDVSNVFYYTFSSYPKGHQYYIG
ncbi:hypothetical protein ACF1UB_002317 [Vibrio fluvialis]